MSRKKVSTTVYLTELQVVALRELHNRTKVPIAEYIRMGIDQILKHYAEHLPGQVSLFDHLDRDLRSNDLRLNRPVSPHDPANKG